MSGNAVPDANSPINSKWPKQGGIPQPANEWQSAEEGLEPSQRSLECFVQHSFDGVHQLLNRMSVVLGLHSLAEK